MPRFERRVTKDNSFYRLVLDFNKRNEGASFRGHKLKLYNVVLKDQRSSNGQRELLFPEQACSLVIENCVFFDVEWNHLAYGHDCEQVAGTVITASNYARAGHPQWYGNMGDYGLTRVEMKDHKAYTITAGADNAAYGVYAGHWSWATAEGPEPTGVAVARTGGNAHGHDLADVLFRGHRGAKGEHLGVFFYLRLQPGLIANTSTGTAYVAVAASHAPGYAAVADAKLGDTKASYFAAGKTLAVATAAPPPPPPTSDPGCAEAGDDGRCKKCRPLKLVPLALKGSQLSWSSGWNQYMKTGAADIVGEGGQDPINRAAMWYAALCSAVPCGLRAAPRAAGRALRPQPPQPPRPSPPAGSPRWHEQVRQRCAQRRLVPVEV